MNDRLDDLKSAEYERRKINGKWSANSGDYVIELTHMYNNQAMAELVAFVVGCDAADLRAPYKDMNPGMERMNINNKLRYALLAKRKQVEVDIRRTHRQIEKLNKDLSKAQNSIEQCEKVNKIEQRLIQARCALQEQRERLENMPEDQEILEELIEEWEASCA